MRETHTHREAETQAEGEAGSTQGARRKTRSQVSRITPWAKGRGQTAEPPRDPLVFLIYLSGLKWELGFNSRHVQYMMKI